MLVPNFGSWDTGTEIPFTAVFEKVRATKDGKPGETPSQTPGRHRFEGNPSLIHPQYEGDKFSNPSSELHRGGKRSALDEWGFQRKASNLQFSSSRSSLEQIADHIFTESQHAAGTESPVISRQSTSSNTSWQNNLAICSRDLREHYVKENIYNQPISGGLPSVYHQGYQVNGSRMVGPVAASPRRERFFQNGTAQDTHPSYTVPATMRQHQHALQANHSSTQVPPNKVLPKFGDWDAVDPASVEFTVIFDKARNERKGSINQDDSSRKKADPRVDEDLYKPISTQRRSGFWALLCCINSSTT